MDAATLNALLENILRFQPSIAIAAQAITGIISIFRMATNQEVDLGPVITRLEGQVQANDTFGRSEIERLKAIIAQG